MRSCCRVLTALARKRARPCRADRRRGRSRPAGTDARYFRAGRGTGRARLGRAGPGGSGLSKARLGRAGMACRTRAPAKTANSGAPRERRLLGQRDQTRAGSGLADYPVFTRKVATDTSYLACARLMLARAMSSSRSSPRTTRIRCRRSRCCPADAAISNISGCMAWARRFTSFITRPRRPSHPALACASMRRWEPTRIFWLISCGACWRTARILLS